jgi:two-component system, chemotaxis family, protein-glutamate methylesterase/glutaminase
MAEPVRVLIVDDSAFVRRAVERMLADEPDLRVVGTAGNGAEAVQMVADLRPDVVILDVNMPELNGLDALKQIMQETPTSVLMMSTLTREGARTTLQALDLGAVDFVDKAAMGTVMNIYSLAPVIREKVRVVAGASVPAPGGGAPVELPEPAVGTVTPHRPRQPGHPPYEVVVIGTSTGGPRALVEVLSRLPADLGSGVVIAQHMPAGFTQTLAERLDRRSPLEVREARHGDVVRPGLALVVPGATQATLARRNGKLVVRVDAGPSPLLHRPSVDLLFSSTAEVVGSRAVGVILTGMGDDGARGLQRLRDAGARTLAESDETAVIYGMPRAAASAAEQILPLPEIGPSLGTLCAPLVVRGGGH